MLGHYKKGASTPKKYLKEFRYNKSLDIELGKEVVLNQFKIGDIVNIQECRPLSKSKRWEVISASNQKS